MSPEVEATAAAGRNEMENNLVATGGIFGALLAAGLDPVIISEGGLATNTMTVQLPYMSSRYRLTVERVPSPPPGVLSV